MLPKQNRLKKKTDFEMIFKDGKGYKEAFLFLKTKSNDLELSRFGFAVGIKISKKAVVRNKIKRWLREAIRKNLSEVKKGFDIVVGASPGIEDKDFHDIKRAVDKLLKRAKLLNP